MRTIGERPGGTRSASSATLLTHGCRDELSPRLWLELGLDGWVCGRTGRFQTPELP